MNYDLPTSLVRYGIELEQGVRRQLADGTASVPGSRALRRRARRPILSAGLISGAVAAVVVILLVATGSTPPAYALTQNQDGSVTVTMHDLATAIPAVNAKFAALGIDETVIPITTGCQTPPVPFGNTDATMSQTLTFVAGRRYLSPGYTGVVAAEQLPDGKVGMILGALREPLPACFSSDPATVHVLGSSVPGGSADAAANAAQALLTAKQAVAAAGDATTPAGQNP